MVKSYSQQLIEITSLRTYINSKDVNVDLKIHLVYYSILAYVNVG